MPGVPPNAFEQVKKTLKGIFKKNKKAKADDKQKEPATATTDTTKPTETKPAAPEPAAAATSPPAETPKAAESAPAAVPSSEEVKPVQPTPTAKEEGTAAPATTTDKSEHGLSATSGPLEDQPADFSTAAATPSAEAGPGPDANALDPMKSLGHEPSEPPSTTPAEATTTTTTT